MVSHPMRRRPLLPNEIRAAVAPLRDVPPTRLAGPHQMKERMEVAGRKNRVELTRMEKEAQIEKIKARLAEMRRKGWEGWNWQWKRLKTRLDNLEKG